MRIKIVSDGRVLSGTPEHVVRQMQFLAFGQEDRSLRAKRSYELLPLPGLSHMVTEPDVMVALNRRIARFFQEHL